MSKVKFIQWGTPTNPKTIEQYNDDFVSVREQYPGGVIFVTYYTDENKTKTKQEIWANGVQYSVGGGGGNVIYGTDMIDATGKTYKWQVDEETGDFVIGEDGQRIPEDTNITGSEGSIYVYTGENTQTAYYWFSTDNGGRWEPFNVDAENVWFHKDITLAGDYVSIGNFSKGSTTATKSVQTLLNKNGTSFTLLDFVTGMLSKAVASGAQFSTSVGETKAEGTITVKNGENAVSTNSYVEVGTTLTVGASLKTNSNVTQYLTANTATYGYRETPNGSTIKANYSQSVTPTTSSTDNDSCTLKLKKPGDTTASTYSSTTYELVNGAHVFTASTTSKTWTGKSFTSKTIIPLNNLGQEEDSITPTTEMLAIYANNDLTPETISPSITVTGYWPVYYGSLATCPSEWTKSNFGSTKSRTIPNSFALAKGHTTVFVAIPSTVSKKITKFETANPVATHGDFSTKSGVSVTLGNSTTTYTVYISTTAVGSTNGNTINVTSSNI